MNILITGASGLLGRACRSAFEDLNPTCCAWSRACEGDLRLDLTDAGAVRTAIEEQKPDLIIHTAAERKPDMCENQRDLTQALNVEATRTLAESAARHGAKLLYLSTDYVFDGSNPPYAVEDACNPLNFYGQTKRAGEAAVLQASDTHVVLRVPILYGEVETLEESPITILLQELFNTDPHKVDDWAIRYPTYVGDVAQTLRNWTDGLLSDPDAAGIFHMSGAEALTKYDMACLIGEALQLDHDHLSPDSEPPAGAPRPQDSQLDISRLEAVTSVQQTAFSTNIQRILTQFLFQT